jgi:hypothetical protein
MMTASIGRCNHSNESRRAHALYQREVLCLAWRNLRIKLRNLPAKTFHRGTCIGTRTVAQELRDQPVPCTSFPSTGPVLHTGYSIIKYKAASSPLKLCTIELPYHKVTPPSRSRSHLNLSAVSSTNTSHPHRQSCRLRPPVALNSSAPVRSAPDLPLHRSQP